jgi:N-acetylglucosaminyldiphosphoundecaprenol N-acetyl-beta-D-mannosaminyltransferase
MRQEELFGLPVTPLPDLDMAIRLVERALSSRTGLLVTFVNPYAWRIGRTQPDFARLLAGFDLVLPDGIGVVKALAWIKGQAAARLSFDASSLYLPVFDRLERDRRRLFVIGAAPGIAATAMRRMQAEFPNVAYAGCLDGYRPLEEAVAAILRAGPDMVLCGMGAPWQERLLLELRRRGFDGVGFTCGGFLDQLAEKPRYYPAWIDKAELRWLYRLCKEPRRLLRRYAVDYAPFIGATLLALARQRLLAGRAIARS